MSFLTIFAIALGLSLDALAVAIASGLTLQRTSLQLALRMALFFGGFQALMPVIGWLAGYKLRSLIEGFDHWIAFALLVVVGAKMIYESFQFEEEKRGDPFAWGLLSLLAIATSIDALAVGLSLSLLAVDIVAPALIIGVVTFSLSLAGVLIGRRCGHFFERKIEIAGGVVLIGIGIKILVEHLG